MTTMMRPAHLLAAAATLALLAMMPVTKIADFDYFLHLRLGQEVLETGSIYWTDTFSYTTEGVPQNTGEWLSNVLMYAVHSAGGFAGAAALKSVLFLLTALVLASALRVQKGNSPAVRAPLMPAATCLTLIVLAYAIRFRLDLRPYYFTYIFIASCLLVFFGYRASGRGRWLLWLPVIQALWGNAHGGSIIGPMLAAAFSASELVRTRRFPLWPSLALAGAFAATWLTPAGLTGAYDPLGAMAPLAGEGARELGEWQPLTAGLLWGYGIRYTLGYQVLVAGAALHLIRRAARRELDLFEVVLFAASIIFPLRAVRLIAPASIMLAPLFHGFIQWAVGPAIRRARLGAAFHLAIAAAALALLTFTVIKSPYYAFGVGPKEGIFPDGALRFLDEHGVEGNAFNTVTVGSYMLYSSPDRKVFIDGRLVPSAAIDAAYDAAIRNAPGLESLARKYGIGYALLDYNPKARWRFPLHINDSPLFSLVYWDDAAALYLRDTPANRPLIERFGYSILRPSFDDYSYLDGHLSKGADALIADKILADEILADEILAKIDADIARNPRNQEGPLARAFALYHFGRKEEALASIKAAHALPPDTSFEHVAHAQLLLEMNRTQEAREALRLALRIDPRDATASSLLARIPGPRD